jgi:hypothetical protein
LWVGRKADDLALWKTYIYIVAKSKEVKTGEFISRHKIQVWQNFLRKARAEKVCFANHDGGAGGEIHNMPQQFQEKCNSSLCEAIRQRRSHGTKTMKEYKQTMPLRAVDCNLFSVSVRHRKAR